MRGDPAELRRLVGTVLPHDSTCCDRGVDHAVEDRTYVVHETATRRWGFTVLRDGKGTIIDRWGNPP